MVNYNAAPNKKAKLVLETTAFKQSRSDLDVAFSTADRETAIFEFVVTQNKTPLLLGNDNVKSSIVFVHSKGLKIRLPLEITDGMNGKISVQVPDDIIKLPGKVTAQVYVARKSTTETYAIVAERIFSFVIEESLAYEFDAETKLNYIVEFDELEQQLTKRAYEIEQAMANAEDYVAKIEQAKDKGLSDIDIAINGGLADINTQADTRVKEITDTGTQYVTNLTTVHDGIEDKINQFNTDVESGGYVQETDTVDWQKTKLTTDDGYSNYIETIDFMNIGDTVTKSGLFYANTSTNGPIDENPSGYIIANFNNVDNGSLVFTPVGSSKKYNAQKINGTWEGLHDLTQDMETQSGAKAKVNEVLGILKMYSDDQLASRFKSIWKGSVKNKDSLLNLSDDITNFRYLIINSSSVGGNKNELWAIDDTGWIVIQNFNLSDMDGSGARMSECTIDMVNNLQLNIRHNHTFVPATNVALPDANTITIKEIVGVK